MTEQKIAIPTTNEEKKTWNHYRQQIEVFEMFCSLAPTSFKAPQKRKTLTKKTKKIIKKRQVV